MTNDYTGEKFMTEIIKIFGSGEKLQLANSYPRPLCNS